MPLILSADATRHYQYICHLTEHVHVEQLGDIPGSISLVPFLEGCAYQSPLRRDHSSLLRGCLTRPHLTNQRPQSDRHCRPLLPLLLLLPILDVAPFPTPSDSLVKTDRACLLFLHTP